jgi:hypothetical protein
MSNTNPTVDIDAEMVAVAQRRGIVRLVNGNLATLISWGEARHRNSKAGRGARCRLEMPDGETRWTARKTDIIEVVQ